VLPLVAIATPATYVREPLRVFELDFEATSHRARLRRIQEALNLSVHVRKSTGMCPDDAFDPENSNIVYGPIHKQRWIYACSKQMMDRVIYAYGFERGLDFTLFRPFQLDRLGTRFDQHRKGRQLAGASLSSWGTSCAANRSNSVDGGKQKRSFTHIDDGIESVDGDHQERQQHRDRQDL